MTQAVIAHTDKTAGAAGEELASTVKDKLDGGTPEALILFASPDQDHAALLASLTKGCSPKALVGCSSAGEFTSERAGEGLTCAVALRSPEMRFTASLGRGLREDRAAAAKQIVDGFSAPEQGFPYRSALVLTDALAGFADELVDQLALASGGVYQFFGGGAGDDARFERTHVFCGTEVATDAAVALEILSAVPVGIGVRHGWSPGGERMRVTESRGMGLVSLNSMPAVEAFDMHAASTGQRFDRGDPIPFFLHNVLGVEGPQGYRLRVPLAVEPDGSVACAADVPTGATSCIMTTTADSAADAAAEATRDALDQLQGHAPAVALVFDCVATRLRLGQEFGAELAAVQRELGDVPFAGFNTYGQIAQAQGQFSGFHNCTAVVCLLPQ